MIAVIGIGMEAGDITVRGKQAMKEADEVYSRTTTRYKSIPLSEKCGDAESFEQLDERICEFLLSREKEGKKVAFLSVGDGYSDTAVKKLAELTRVEIIPGVADNRARQTGSDVLFVSAYDVEKTQIDSRLPLVVYQIDGKDVASDVKLALMKFYDDEMPVRLAPGGEVISIPLSEIDHYKIAQSSSLFIEGDERLIGKKRYGFSDLLYIMKRLTAPDGCPWDRAQTHESIAANMLEEAYEAVEAINNGDGDNLKEELGDVMLQTVFHADMSEKEGDFDINDVINELCVKLVGRHTHIFGEDKATDSESALYYWEKAKAKEKHYSTLSEQIDRLPDNFPATMLLGKFIKKANKSGANVTEDELKKIIADNLACSDCSSTERLLSATVMLAELRGYSAEELMLKKFACLKSVTAANNLEKAVKDKL